jgi:hypothetical protein
MRPLPLPQLFVAELLRRRVDQGEQIRQQLLRATLIVLKNKASSLNFPSTYSFVLSLSWQMFGLFSTKSHGYCEMHNNRPKTAETSAIRVS